MTDGNITISKASSMNTSEMFQRVVNERVKLYVEDPPKNPVMSTEEWEKRFRETMNYFASRNEKVMSDERVCNRAAYAAVNYVGLYSTDTDETKRLRELNRLESSITKRVPFKETLNVVLFVIGLILLIRLVVIHVF